jgi:aspartate racemase
VVREETRQAFLAIIGNLRMNGAEGIILGCTEFSLLLQQSDCDFPLFNTARIHAQAAVDFALNQ